VDALMVCATVIIMVLCVSGVIMQPQVHFIIPRKENGLEANLEGLRWYPAITACTASKVCLEISGWYL